MSFAFTIQTRRRKPSLTPMIDVVFLLLVFFMLAARFTVEGGISIAPAGGTTESYSGPPRLVVIQPDGLLLNGRAVTDLALELDALTQNPDDMILLRSSDGVDLQRLVDVMEALTQAGFTGLVLVE